MQLKTLKDIDLKGKTVLYRVAYDIEPVEENGELVVRDTTRIEATLPTLQHLIQQQCKIVLLTWVKRPGGKVVENLRTAPHARALAELLGKPVKTATDCVGPAVERAVADLKEGELLMLENVRFHPEEEQGVHEGFARELAKGKDILVFDAFAQAHRKHASTVGILQALPSVAGLLMEREMETFENILEHPNRPLVAILGGAKVSDKVSTMRFLLPRVDALLIGGALASTFLHALGRPTEHSFTEATAVDDEQKTMDIPAIAAALYRGAPRERFLLPNDLIASADQMQGTEMRVIDPWESRLPSGWQYLDIGPKTIARYQTILATAKTIFWNGPMGLFEVDQFSKGTRAIADAVLESGAFSIIGGGDTETIVTKFGLHNRFNWVSTGGGVSLELLAGKELPVVQFLKK